MKKWAALAGVAAAALTPQFAVAETLREALVRSYETNPTLMAERERLRQVDEGVAIARSGLRPQFSATIGLSQDVVTTTTGEGRGLNLGGDISYPVFTGGRVRSQIRAADSRVEAGRGSLRAREGDVFSTTVTAYMDVIRDRSIVSLNENQVRVLETNLRATRDRFEIGELTRTDVAQSEARLSIARSNLSNAQGQLRGSEEAYRQTIGVFPGELEPPPMLPRMPETMDEASRIALADNPALQSVAGSVRAAGYDVATVRADRLPTVSATSTGQFVDRLGTADDQFGAGSGVANRDAEASVGVSARVPIYQGGLVSARVRQAQATQGQLTEQLVGTERAVVEQSRSAFATYRASLEAIQSNEIAVAANQLALEGTRAEQTVGTRNVLDVLNAEQELLTSQVQLIVARRDAYVAGFALLNIMGSADAEDLGLDGGALYDPTIHYRQVRNIASDWRDAPVRGPTSTRTVPADANSPVTPLLQRYGPPAPRATTAPASETPVPTPEATSATPN